MIDYEKISSNPEVVALLKQLEELEQKIMALEPMALMHFAIARLSEEDRELDDIKTPENQTP